MSCVMRRCSDLNCLLDQEPPGFSVSSLASCHIHLRGKTLPRRAGGYSRVLALQKWQLLPRGALKLEVETPLSWRASLLCAF